MRCHFLQRRYARMRCRVWPENSFVSLVNSYFLAAFGMAIHPIQIEAQAPSRLVTLIFRVFAAISHAFVVYIFGQIRDFGKLCCGVSV